MLIEMPICVSLLFSGFFKHYMPTRHARQAFVESLDKILSSTSNQCNYLALALAAANAVGGVAVFPIFAINERGKAFSDFNDLDQKFILGREELKRQLRTAYRKMQTIQQVKMQKRQQQVERPQRQRDFSR
jgi:phage/plasmid primase-like uncharacterized protein